ncbi:holo-ACP synthase [Nitrincola sp. MINF-07-Sa-05]|uniref:holo-ACP synthase n=1 Tax=Nitrincola salilacus TaxID=3400273 RepID=UPI003917EB4B
MILGLGLDILQIARIEQALTRTPRLAQRILTQKEYDLFLQQTDQPRFLAKRFAAKEAAVKALGTGIGHGVGWQQLSISHDDLGKPSLTVTGHAAEIAQQKGISHWHLSYSDERDLVAATVIAEG